AANAMSASAALAARAPPILTLPWLDQHAPLHLHVHRVTEPLAVVPVDAGAIRLEGDRRRGLWSDLHGDAVVDDGEAVREILDLVAVGDVHGDLVALA